MKDYKKFIKEVLKDKDFVLTKSKRKTTYKLTHVPTGQLYSIHEGDQAIRPIKSWIKKIKKL
ncbi:MAG: hypothetical protein PQJ49_07965 [Sphaerochaetaceae bacterium]|nr:hypothetical protein [Sphaerochaetaceae bacterium]